MADMAAELLKLYAQRKSRTGALRFSPDNKPAARVLKMPSPFTETDDQLSAIADIKNDHGVPPSPWTALLCGDVGYGKTEVAHACGVQGRAGTPSRSRYSRRPLSSLSSTMKASKKRFANFPVKVEMLSRFRTAKEKTAIVEQAEQGKIDILIGTPRHPRAEAKVPGPRTPYRR